MCNGVAARHPLDHHDVVHAQRHELRTVWTKVWTASDGHSQDVFNFASGFFFRLGGGSGKGWSARFGHVPNACGGVTGDGRGGGPGPLSGTGGPGLHLHLPNTMAVRSGRCISGARSSSRGVGGGAININMML